MFLGEDSLQMRSKPSMHQEQYIMHSGWNYAWWTRLLWTGPLLPCRQFLPTTASLSPRLKKRPSWRSFCSSQKNQTPEKNWSCAHPFPHWMLLPLRPRPIWCCCRLSSKSPHIWCSCMDRWLRPLSFGCQRCRCPGCLW